MLNLEGIRGTGVSGVVFAVYINLPEGEEPDVHSPYFVGSFSLFGRQPMTIQVPQSLTGDGEHQGGHMDTQPFYIAQNVAELQARGEWTGDSVVTIVPHGATAAPGAACRSPYSEAAGNKAIQARRNATG